MNTIEKIKNEKSPIIIFGAGGVGQALFYSCVEAGIKIECFCDNSAQKIKELVCNTKVIHTSDLKNKYPEAVFLISASDIKDVVLQLDSFGYSKWYSCASLLRNFDVYKHQFSVETDFVDYMVNVCLLCHDSFLNPDKIFLRSVDIIITERCSLKCRDCSNLTQYYKNPQNCDTKDLLKSIDVFCDIVDEINEFRVIGGEPFMNREFHLITNRLVQEPKVKKVVFYTNGTIIPSDEQLKSLMNKKVFIIITDYGALSRNIKGLMQKLEHNNIAFYVRKANGWTDCSKIIKHNRPVEQNKKILRDCCAKNTFTLSNNKLFHCPFAANADRLSAVPSFENDFIDILQQDNGTKTKVKEFVSNIDFLKVCDWCNGRPFDGQEIQPAVQISKPLDYERI